MASTANTGNPTVSVIVPVFNRATTVARAVDSVLRQTYSDFEVVAVDDCSTDDSASVIRSIQDERIRVVVSERNLGIAGARNLGVANSRGHWVAFQDSDDEWLPRKLERQMDLLSRPGQSNFAVYCGMLRLGRLDAGNRRRIEMDYVPHPSVDRVDGDILDALLDRSFVSTQTLVVRRDIFDELGGFDPDMPVLVDYDFAVRLARLGPIACIDEPLVLQRFSADSVTRQIDRRLESQARVVEKFKDLYASRPALLSLALYRIAGGYREQGDYTTASEFLARARRAQPVSPRLLAMSAYVAVRRRLPGRLGGHGPTTK
jgi:glycosyltransferase involved in cell wall biosynthesis